MHKVKMGPRIIFNFTPHLFLYNIFRNRYDKFIVPYKSYTLITGMNLCLPTAILPDKIINLSSIGVSSPRDIYVSKRNNIYVVDSNGQNYFF